MKVERGGEEMENVLVWSPIWASLPLAGVLVALGAAWVDVGAAVGAAWAAAFLGWVAHRRRSGKAGLKSRLPPGPMSLPVIGHLHLVTTLPHKAFYKMSKKYGPAMFLRLGSAAPTLVVSTAATAREVLHLLDEPFSHRPHMEFGDRLVYGSRGSVFAENNPTWRTTRRLYATQLMSPRSVQLFKDVRDEETAAMIRSVMSRHHGPLSAGVPIREVIFDYTLNVLMRLLFSERADGRLAGLSDIVRETSGLFTLPIVGELIPSVHWFDPFSTRKKIDSVHTRFNAIIESLVEARIEQPADQRPADMLTTMLASTDDILLVKAMIMELLIAGTETTSSTVESAMAEVLRDARILKKLREELDSKVGEKQQVEDEDLGSLEYLRAVIKETWRLHPPIQMLLPHLTKQDVTVAGYHVPANTRLFVNAWAVGRDESAWVERVHEFWPDRFMDPQGPSKDVTTSSPTFELLPFGRGRRSCPGLHLGTSFSHLALANLVHRYNWTLPPSFTISMEDRPGGSFALANPLVAIPTPRK